MIRSFFQSFCSGANAFLQLITVGKSFPIEQPQKLNHAACRTRAVFSENFYGSHSSCEDELADVRVEKQDLN